MTNKTQRQMIYFIAIFVVPFTGGHFFQWTVYQSISVLFMMALIMKLTDLEDSLCEYFIRKRKSRSRMGEK